MTGRLVTWDDDRYFVLPQSDPDELLTVSGKIVSVATKCGVGGPMEVTITMTVREHHYDANVGYGSEEGSDADDV